MKKLLLLLASCCMTMSNASGATWKKVTSAIDLTLDGEYVIACAEKGALMGWDINGKSFLPSVQCTSLTETTTEITELPTNTAIVKFEGDKWSNVTLHIYAEDGTSKGYYKTTAAKKMSIDTTSGTGASVSLNNNNIVIDLGDTNGKLQYNATSPRFLNYTSSQTAVQLFINKDATAPDDTRADADLSFAEDIVNYDINDEFVKQKLSNPDNLTVTWKSSNDQVASIDATSGDITINATGSTIIRANFAGNDAIKPGSAEYELVVANRKVQTITFNFINETYGMTRLSGTTSQYNPDPTIIGNGWIGVKLTGEKNNRLWDDGLRIYNGATITIYAPEGCTLSSVNSGCDFVINETKTEATYTHSDKKITLEQIEVTYTGMTNEELAAAFQTGSSLSLTVENAEYAEGTCVKSSEADAKVSIANVYPHAKIYYSWTADAAEAATFAEAGYEEYTAPLSLDRAGQLNYYAELNDQRTAVQTLTVTGPTTTGISEIEATGATSIEWFDLSGRRVAAPAKGVYLRKQGAKVTKIAY